MTNDLETDQFVDKNGVLTPIFTETDKDKIEESIDTHRSILLKKLEELYESEQTASGRYGILELMKQLRHPFLNTYITKFQQEL